MPLLVAIVFLCIIFVAGLWWLAGDVSDNRMSHMAEFGLLLFDSLLAVVIFILAVGGVFGYRFLRGWVKDEARETMEKHLETEAFKKELKELVKKEMEDFTEEARHSLTEELTPADEVSSAVAQAAVEEGEK